LLQSSPDIIPGSTGSALDQAAERIVQVLQDRRLRERLGANVREKIFDQPSG
jgi:hypothetical protein